MKIKRLFTFVALMGKGHSFSFDKSNHTIEFRPDINMFEIDGDTLVPMHNVREILLETPFPSDYIIGITPIREEIANIPAKEKIITKVVKKHKDALDKLKEND
jgi:hypothetical protein